MWRENGLDYFGADEAKPSDGGVLSFLKKEAPGALAAVSEEIEKRKDKKAGDKKVDTVASDKGSGGKGGKPGKSSGGNWFTRPVIGPLPGGVVLALGLGAVTGLGFAVKKIFF